LARPLALAGDGFEHINAGTRRVLQRKPSAFGPALRNAAISASVASSMRIVGALAGWLPVD